MRHLTTNLQLRRADPATGTAERCVEALAVPYDTPLDRFGGMWQEEIEKGAVDVAALPGTPMLWGHDEAIGLWTDAHDSPAGPVVVGRISETDRGADVYRLCLDYDEADAPMGASIGFEVLDSRSEIRDGREVDVFTRIDIREISLTPIPAYREARVSQIRQEDPMPTRVARVTDRVPADPEDAGRALLARAADDAAALGDLGPDLIAQLREVAARTAALEAGGRGNGHPLAGYSSLGEYVAATRAGTETRAWIDQITANNPGVIPPAWLQEVKGILELGRPAVTALGGPRTLPETGMRLDFPYYDGSLSTLVAEQTTEAAEITSARVDLKLGTAPVRTFAGGSAVSAQLIDRASPSYVDAYLRILGAAYALLTEQAYIAALTAGGTGTETWPLAGVGNPTTAQKFLRSANRKVVLATGQPATAWIASPDVVDKFDVTEAAVDRFLDELGLRPTEDPAAPAGTCILTNSVATGFHEDGGHNVNQDVIRRLSRDYVIFGFVALPVYLPKGVVKGSQALAADPTKK